LKRLLEEVKVKEGLSKKEILAEAQKIEEELNVIFFSLTNFYFFITISEYQSNKK